MTIAKNMKELEKLINKKIANGLQNEVANEARRVMKENVITEVYQKYSPTNYERTGGLYQDKNIETKLVDDNTLTVRNIREENGRDIANIIETGTGYDWERSRIYNMQPYPRPFHAETARELDEKGLAKNALKKGLERQGLNVK